jgi:hypothetical protein
MGVIEKISPICALAVVLVSSLGVTPTFACDLQPANQNPADVPGIEMSRLAAQVNETFKAGSKSNRNYDLVDPFDGMTLAFGNWPQQEVEDFFKDMKSSNDGRAFVAFTDCMTAFFAKKEKASENAWRLAQAVAKVASADPTHEQVTTVLDRTLLNKSFMKRYAKHCRERCRRGEPDLYNEQKGWLVPALRYALRDREVINWQVDYWTRTIVWLARSV